MARTHRNLDALIYVDGDGDSIMRNANARRLTHHSTRRTELRAFDALRDADVVVRNRVRGRAFGTTLTNYHDDRPIVAGNETDFRHGRFDRRVECEAAA
jgi:hypothetical protein